MINHFLLAEKKRTLYVFNLSKLFIFAIIYEKYQINEITRYITPFFQKVLNENLLTMYTML